MSEETNFRCLIKSCLKRSDISECAVSEMSKTHKKSYENALNLNNKIKKTFKEKVDELIESFAGEQDLNKLLCSHARMAIAKHEHKSTSQEELNLRHKYKRMLIFKETTPEDIATKKKVMEDIKHEEQQKKNKNQVLKVTQK